jgi:hypothetical protein
MFTLGVCNNNIYIRGIKELIMNENSPSDEQIIKEISFNFGLLLYLKEELSMLKNKSYEYFVRCL